MEFLPLSKDGKYVYAGFWKRLGAAIVDFVVWIPFLVLVYYASSINMVIALGVAVIQAFIYSIYYVSLNLVYGGTLGKLLVGIRITKPNGGKIGIQEALLRSAVDIVYGFVFAVAQIYALSQVDADAFLKAGYIDRMNLLAPLYPAYNAYAQILFTVWYWSELIVLLFNKRRRALHDYIAGTVVIHKEFTLQIGNNHKII